MGAAYERYAAAQVVHRLAHNDYRRVRRLYEYYDECAPVKNALSAASTAALKLTAARTVYLAAKIVAGKARP